MTRSAVPAPLRRITSAATILALVLFSLLSRADLALVGAADHGFGIICSNAADGSNGPAQDRHQACVLACAMVCHAQILPPAPELGLRRLAQTLAPRPVRQDAVAARRSTHEQRIRGPPETALA